MYSGRTLQLEQALLAVIASASKMGISCDALCAEAVGGLMADRYWQWSLIEHKHGAADEIEEALTKLLMRTVAKSPPVYLASPMP
ncbi:hypothetical protein C9I49_22130 [Pseudomonas prosekii]|uniref:Uncharacterized protein n=1 Tax=Pseudomonas prosekii TaxID=1148509 RepID=A0A2U2D332_9PSED|nr:hypothetical protein C9I49_22130 [Pseudomonas prosekii]